MATTPTPKGYQNIRVKGNTTSTTIDPRKAIEDVDLQLRTLNPAVTPLMFLGNKLGRGSAPKNHKVQVMSSAAYDPFDTCSLEYAGQGNNARLARLKIDGISRPFSSEVIFHPQDLISIIDTGQVVQVVMTPDACFKINGSEATIADTTLTGGTTSRCKAGTVIVKVLQPVAFKSFSGKASIVDLGRTIFESQAIEAVGKRSTFLYDYNFVEHKEGVINFSEDTKKWVQNKPGLAPEWTYQEKLEIETFKTVPELLAIWGERSEDFSEPSRPLRTMRGLIHSIQTNVSYYNPSAVTSYEDLVITFLHEHAFKYLNPTTNSQKKMGMAGRNFLLNFNKAFQGLRRNTNINGSADKIGMNFSTYELPGGFTVTLTGTEAFRSGTPSQNWCAIIDPSLAQWRIAKDFTTREYANNNERDYKLMMEWQGTISWNLEQVNALLRTV